MLFKYSGKYVNIYFNMKITFQSDLLFIYILGRAGRYLSITKSSNFFCFFFKDSVDIVNSFNILVILKLIIILHVYDEMCIVL